MSSSSSRRYDEQKKRAELTQKDLLRGLPLDHPLRLDAVKRGII